MARDMNLLFYPEKKEYIVVSEGYQLKLDQEDFKSVKKTANGISHALKVKCKQMKKERARS